MLIPPNDVAGCGTQHCSGSGNGNIAVGWYQGRREPENLHHITWTFWSHQIDEILTAAPQNIDLGRLGCHSETQGMAGPQGQRTSTMAYIEIPHGLQLDAELTAPELLACDDVWRRLCFSWHVGLLYRKKSPVAPCAHVGNEQLFRTETGHLEFTWGQTLAGENVCQI